MCAANSFWWLCCKLLGYFYSCCCCKFGTRKLQIVEEMRCYEYELSNFHFYFSSLVLLFSFSFLCILSPIVAAVAVLLITILFAFQLNAWVHIKNAAQLKFTHFINNCDFKWISVSIFVMFFSISHSNLLRLTIIMLLGILVNEHNLKVSLNLTAWIICNKCKRQSKNRKKQEKR